jgi:hypothetical protein
VPAPVRILTSSPAEARMLASRVHHFVVEPLTGVGPIRFGMHKDEVSHAFTYVYTSFFKGRRRKVRSDHCEVVGLIMHYDGASRVNYIEVNKAEYATVTIELFGRDITGISVRGLADFLTGRGVRAVKTTTGYDFPELGLNTYNSDRRSDDVPIECLGVGLPAER